MKKLILSLLLLNMCIFRCYADEYSTDGDYTINLSCIKAPVYSLKIPKTIDVVNVDTVLSFSLKGDIYADQVLKVVFDETTTLSCGQQSVTVYINQNKDTWTAQELSDTYQNSSITISHTELTAGVWSGRLNVLISLQGE